MKESYEKKNIKKNKTKDTTRDACIDRSPDQRVQGHRDGNLQDGLRVRLLRHTDNLRTNQGRITMPRRQSF